MESIQIRYAFTGGQYRTTCNSVNDNGTLCTHAAIKDGLCGYHRTGKLRPKGISKEKGVITNTENGRYIGDGVQGRKLCSGLDNTCRKRIGHKKGCRR